MELVWGQILPNFNYGKCVGKNLRLPILWENYGNKVPFTRHHTLCFCEKKFSNIAMHTKGCACDPSGISSSTSYLFKSLCVPVDDCFDL